MKNERRVLLRYDFWAILVIFKDGKSNISSEAYFTYDEAVAEMKKRNCKRINEWVFYDEENGIKYEIKSIYIK